jgi:rhamnose utilization protein RhaD (predicted bifunctional aldolase and dehydrogenase)
MYLEKTMKDSDREHLECLAELSARLGNNPLLTQAASGNTSLKIGNTLWIKSSGAWLSRALREQIFVGVKLDTMRNAVQGDKEPTPIIVSGTGRASVETPMHSVLPESVVIHVHSVNMIAWAVRRDGSMELEQRLTGLDWRWIPYVASGLPLARAILAALAQAPRTRIFVLANHGLVITGPDMASAERLLDEVEDRIRIEPRSAPMPDFTALQSAAWPGWQSEPQARPHSLATDPTCFEIVTSGTLFPCQAIFLAEGVRFCLLEGRGVLTRDDFSRTEREVLEGLAEVALRIPDVLCVRYLSSSEVDALLNADVYRHCGQSNDLEGKVS